MTPANTRRAFDAWVHRRPSRVSDQGTGVWTDGTTIFSYRTAIVDRVVRGDTAFVVFNDTDYSMTTKRHQNALLQLLGNRIASMLRGGIPQDTTSLDPFLGGIHA